MDTGAVPHPGAVTATAAASTVHVFAWASALVSPAVEQLDPVVSVCSMFQDIATLFSRVVGPVCIPVSCYIKGRAMDRVCEHLPDPVMLGVISLILLVIILGIYEYAF